MLKFYYENKILEPVLVLNHDPLDYNIAFLQLEQTRPFDSAWVWFPKARTCRARKKVRAFGPPKNSQIYSGVIILKEMLIININLPRIH
jgi:hypothetical protein